MVYADLPNRVIAYIIDIIVLAIITIVVGIILAAIGLAATSGSGVGVSTNWVGSIIFALVALAINGAYFIYSWTNRRATLGMQALGNRCPDARGYDVARRASVDDDGTTLSLAVDAVSPIDPHTVADLLNNTITALTDTSITVHNNEHGDLTCSISDGSPSLVGFHVGDFAGMGCKAGVLVVLVKRT